jgi:hypothetical protein
MFPAPNYSAKQQIHAHLPVKVHSVSINPIAAGTKLCRIHNLYIAQGISVIQGTA